MLTLINKHNIIHFQQSGYERINEDLFAFINIGYKGNSEGTLFKYGDEA